MKCFICGKPSEWKDDDYKHYVEWASRKGLVFRCPECTAKKPDQKRPFGPNTPLKEQPNG